jgi:Tfp pilus assembly protein PilF
VRSARPPPLRKAATDIRAVVPIFALLAALGAGAAEPLYQLQGSIHPEGQASVTIFGATTPFQESALSDHRGRFRFRRLLAGTYTVAVFIPGRGEVRQTVAVGPAGADRRGRLGVRIDVSEANVVAEEAIRRRNLVSVRELSVPPQARREYEEARKKLARRDAAGAAAHLERAVQLAPQFAEAWNTLGTIAYQSREYEKAATYFREALEQEPGAYEPLVNLGGVLLNLDQPEEALAYNRHAVLRRSNDALAHSQLGQTYFFLGQLDLAIKHLNEAKRLDPSHFSHPQLVLAEIYLQRQENQAAAAELQEFVRRHPDDPNAGRWREAIAKLQQ